MLEFDAGTAIGWEGQAIGTHALHAWRLQSTASGTRVETEESMQGWLVRPLRRSMTKVLQRGLVSTLAGLEQESVRRAAARRDLLLTR